MGGHGGLNILPQKRWNVYNWDNREKVKRDEEAAAREEQLRLEQARRAEADFRLDRLRRARGIATDTSTAAPAATPSATSEPVSGTKEASERDSSGHINLFENSFDFGFLGEVSHREAKKAKREEAADSHKKDHKRRREEKEKAKEAKVITPEEEKYRLGYGLAGKGVKKPWYLTKPVSDNEVDGDKEMSTADGKRKKKSIAELREERMARERTEKERERKLLALAGKRGFSR